MDRTIRSDFNMELGNFARSFGNIIDELKQQHKKMLITMHRYLDGDAFGSAVALGLILRRFGIDSALVCVPFLPEKFDFLSRISRLMILEVSQNRRIYRPSEFAQSLQAHFPEKIADYGALTILDCAGFGQVPEEAWAIGLKFPHKINIDHHVGHSLDTDEKGVLNLVGDCSSTSEVLFQLMAHLGVDPDPEIAVPLYVGITADLRKNDISVESNAYPTRMVESLKTQVEKMGADTDREIKAIFSLDPWESYLLNAIKDRIRFSENIVYVSFDPDMVLAAKRETDSLDNPRMPFHEFHIQLRQLLQQFKEAYPIVVLFDQMLGKVSLYDQNRDDTFDLARISRELGGGGHANRAGFSFEAAGERLLENGILRIDDSEDIVMDKIVEFIGKQLV